MGIITDAIKKILSDEELFAKFISLRANSSEKIKLSQLAEIFHKDENVTSVRSYDEWKSLGRQVWKGERAFGYFDKNSNTKHSFAFDIKQTKGHIYKPEKISLEKFNLIFSELETASQYLFGEDLQEKKFRIIKLLDIRREENVKKQIDGRDSEPDRGENSNGIRLDDRRNNGDGRISRTRERAPVGYQISFLDGFSETNQQIRAESGRIYEREQLQEVVSSSRNNDVGEGVDSATETDRSVYGRENGRVHTTEERGILREGNAPSDVSVGNGTFDIQRIYTPVRYELTENDFIHRGPKERCHDNIKAIKVIKTLQQENRPATAEEQSMIAKYVGWGGLPEVFDEKNSSWIKEYNELKELLSENEYDSARGSVLNAHFTPKNIIDGIYTGLNKLGATKGKALEPSCGTGNFLGCVPENFNLTFDGVELDGITSDIARALYPTDNIQNNGFENIQIKDGTYDLVIGNVPFGDYRIYDSDYNRHKFVIHDYFIAKSLDKLKANGIMAVITGKGSLDKLTPTAREYYAQRATLIGAYRLPNTAFKSSAGTEAVADVLFFQKRENLVTLEQARETETWINTVEKDGIRVNQYFIDNPDHVIGEFKIVSGPFGNERTVIATSDDLGEQLKSVLLSTLPDKVTEVKQNQPSDVENVKEDTTDETERLTAEELDELGVKDFSICLFNDKIYFRENNELVPHPRDSLKKPLNAKAQDRVKAYIELTKQALKVVEVQCDDCSDDVLKGEQVKLNKVYDDFVKKFGCVSSKENSKYFDNDIDYALVSSLENYDESTKTAQKAQIFFKRTIRRPEKVTHTDDVYEALAICRSELGEVDIHFIEKLTGLSYDDVITKLNGAIYRNPIEVFDNQEKDKYLGWETRDEYLSGDIIDKIEQAEYYKIRISNNYTFGYPAEQTQELLAYLDKNIEVLNSVKPEPLKYTDIHVRLGATWVETDDYARFIATLMNTSVHGYEVIYSPHNGQYSIQVPQWIKHTAEARNIYGTERMNAIDVFEHALNNRTVTVYDKVRTPDGKDKRVVNKEETAMAREKVREMNNLFATWLWERDEKRRSKYEEIYNKRFNGTVLPEYSGEHLTFNGMNENIELRDHQKQAVARICNGKNTLLHHSVGAGKTFEIIAGAMKLKQYGLANKSMIVVPNPLVSQWAKDVKILYPNAKVLVATKEQFEKNNRKRFISKIATGDWDMVILAESQFVRIPVSEERQLKKTEDIINRIRDQLEEQQSKPYYAHGRSLTIKALTAILKKKETKYKELQDKVKKVKDNILPFEKLGVDYLFVDEAHLYKNKEIETSMTNVAGLSTGGSERAFDLEMKIDYLSELHGGDKGVVFATGTPVANSMSEMYTMQSYLARTELEAKGLTYFDAWASNFGEVVTSWELNTSGKGVKARTRFARFVNLPELQKMYRSFADVKTAEMLNLPVPKVIRQTISLPATEQITAYNDEIIRRGQAIENGGVPPTEDNMLKLSSDGKKLALDPRCLDENAFDEEGTKVNSCVYKVFDIWENTKEDKLTQVIFCDQSTPKENGWDVYHDIKDKLVAIGVPENEIEFIHNADTEDKKEKLFNKLNSGDVRVLIGSTQKCGVGANFQKKLKALHHLDVPYRPADMEQREGRIIRQGNTNAEVEIYSYITERTFDSYSYQILENKQRFISQINKGDMTIREASDIDEQTLSFAQIKAIATADDDFLRQVELVNTIKELRMLRSKFAENQAVMKRKLTTTLPEQLAYVGVRLNDVTQDVNTFVENPQIKIDGQTFTERAKAGEVFAIVFKKAKDGDVIGEYGGLKIVAHKEVKDGMQQLTVSLKGNATYRIDMGESGLGNITRIENAYKGIPIERERLAERVANIKGQMDEIATSLEKKWEREEELRSAEKELEVIEKKLQVDKDEVAEEDTAVETPDTDKREKTAEENEKENG